MDETTTAPIPCPICGTGMKLTVTTNRNGKHAIGVHCPVDGRHFRGFINHKPYVADMLSRLAEAMASRGTAPDPAEKALQNPKPAPAATSGTGRRRT